MKSAEPKSAAISTIQKKSNTPFFDTEHASEQESPFFAPQEASGTDAFFQPATRPIIQTKLTVGQPNDKYEQEADTVADKVVQRLAKSDNTNHQSTPSVSEASTPIIQHKTDAPEEEKLDRKEDSKEELPELQKSPVSAVGDDEGLQMKCAACEAEEDSGHVQMKGNTEGVASSNIESQLNSSKGGGSALPDTTRTQMESAIGADFSNVRVHTGSNAVQMSQDLNAQAFTHGSDVYFNEGKYNPSGTEGGRLLAHELTHTVQQGGNKRIEQSNNKSSEHNLIQRFEAPGHEAAERTALTEGGTFSNEEASMVYYGNWMRDMNQALVPALTGILEPDLLFSLVNFLGYKKFGRFMNAEQLGYYIPSEHIDNPSGQVKDLDYSSAPPKVSASMQNDKDRFDTTSWDKRPSNVVTKQDDNDPLTGNVLGTNLFAVDQTGVIAYIRRTNLHVENRLEYAANKGRTPEGLMHFGAALHAIEDLFAHSNFVEIALDKVLKESTYSSKKEDVLLPDLKSKERYVRKMTSTINERPVMTTGSFTGLDTMESLGSEAVKMLKEGMKPTANEIEKKAQDKFIGQMLKSLDSNKELKNKIVNKYGGENDTVKDYLKQNSLYAIYNQIQHISQPVSFVLSLLLPDITELKNDMISMVNEYVLNPAGKRIEAHVLITKVQDTPVYKSEPEINKTIEQKGKNLSPIQEMGYNITKKTPDYASIEKEARQRKELLEKTPEKIKVGPSHSQLAKDHKDSVFFGLAFQLAVEADKLLRDKMVNVWGTSPKVQDPDTKLLEKDKNKLSLEEKENYAFAKVRHDKDADSLAWGQFIYKEGHAESQEYSLENIRNESAARVKNMAYTLMQLSDSPKNLRKALKDIQKLLGDTAFVETDSKKILNHYLNAANNYTYSADEYFEKLKLSEVSQQFMDASILIKNAKTLEERELSYQELLKAKSSYLKFVAQNIQKSPSMVTFYALFAVSIDREMASVAPAYPKEQITKLDDTSNELEQKNVTLPSLDKVTNPKIKALLETARMIINHPHETTWWKQHVVKFAKANKEQLTEEVKARNAGYVKLK